VLNARTKYDLIAAIAKFGELAAGAMAIASESVFTDEGEILGQLAKRYNVPAVLGYKYFTPGNELRILIERPRAQNFPMISLAQPER
jgi:hypothetical protein